jgi:NTP pyrophosphatase (non-canonical NTP hydrolase)
MGYTIWPDGPAGDALSEVNQERHRQEQLREEGRFAHTCAGDGLSNPEKLVVLAEEFGEVARAVLEHGKLASDVHGNDLRKELCQVAAVAVAWMESLGR